MNEYEKKVLEGRKQFLKLVQQQERELLSIYEEAAKRTILKLTKAETGTLTHRYLSELDKSLIQYTNYLRYNLSKSVKDNIGQSSKIASDIQKSYMELIAPSQDLKNTFNKMFTQLSDDVVKQLISGKYYEDGKSLDKRLWNLTSKNAKDIDNLIKVNVAKGVNARELANELDAYINPSNRMQAKTFEAKINKKISYQAQRLARTSLTHANVETYIQGSKMNPFCEGLKWNLSPSHFSRMKGRTDICDEYSGKVFKINEYPISHPNCLCYPTQEVIDIDKARNELIDWVNGDDNTKLDKWLNDYGEEFGIEKNQSKEKTNLLHEEIKITKKQNNNEFTVDRKLVNSKEYHDKFEELPLSKQAKEKLYIESKKVLEHRDGTEFEDLIILDSKTGYEIVSNRTSNNNLKTGLTMQDYEKVISHNGDIILLHNHPGGGRLSASDIVSAYKQEKVVVSIVAGHDGSIHYIYNINRKVDIERIYSLYYNKYKQLGYGNDHARIKANDELYNLKLFDYIEE